MVRFSTCEFGGDVVPPIIDGKSFPGRWSSCGKGFSPKGSSRCPGTKDRNNAVYFGSKYALVGM